MLEPVVINLDLDDDNSMTNTASENNDEMFRVLRYSKIIIWKAQGVPQ